jgi:suppressor of tumorigenicity protein 13
MSKTPFTAAHISQLSGFINLCKDDPKILHNPELAFFKNYIESLGGKIPATLPETDFESPEADIPEPRKAKESEAKPEPAVEVESEESDIELDNSGIIGRYFVSFIFIG